MKCKAFGKGVSCGIAAFAVASIFGCATAPEVQSQETQVLVEELLNHIQRALITVQDDADKSGLPKLDSVTLKLATQLIDKGEGKINLFIVSFGGSASKETAQTLTLILTPPPPGAPKPVTSTKISENLAHAILAGLRGTKRAMLEKPPLLLSQLTANIKFVVKLEGGGGVKFTILPVTAELGVNVSSVETHEITVTFKNK